jgi:hypothetical protein
MYRWGWLGGLVLALLGLCGGAGATAILDLGTAGRAGSFQATGCGGILPVGQFGDFIDVTGGGCAPGSRIVVSETFSVPAWATDLRLSVSDFTWQLPGTVLLNGVKLGDCDDGCAGVVAGAANRIEIEFGGVGLASGPPEALLMGARLSYDGDPGLGPPDQGRAVPEPASAVVMLGSLALLAGLARRR